METLLEQPSTAVASCLPEIARFRFLFEAVDPIQLPPFPGSALRGMLGYGLRRTACVTRQPVCDGCLLRGSCVYSTLFETPALGGGAGARYTKLPHPFVLDLASSVREGIAAGDTFVVGINLIGPAIAHAPFLIHALQLAGQRGLGKGGGRFRIASLERECSVGVGDWQVVYTPGSGEYQAVVASGPHGRLPAAAGATVGLRLLTPLRIKRRGHLVGPAELEPADLLRTLCERLALLAEHYGGDAAGFQWPRLRERADDVRIIEKDVRWHDWTRFSSRQDTLMQMGGLLGDLRLAGPGLAAFWPALWYGQWAHVGKGTSLGLGGYSLAPC
jgi:hypothetical protein